jgi:hypothetical protein
MFGKKSAVMHPADLTFLKEAICIISPELEVQCAAFFCLSPTEGVASATGARSAFGHFCGLALAFCHLNSIDYSLCSIYLQNV